MGRQSSITIQPYPPMHPITALKRLLENGWRYDAFDTISYLPPGDDGMFDWQFAPSDQGHEVERICRLKADQGETLGIALTWEETSIGGEFLLFPDSKIQVSLSINRVRLSASCPYTDFSWYLPRVLAPFIDTQRHLESIHCWDIE